MGVNTTAANLDLANNPFYREFTTPVALTEAAAALPQMQGSGWVRDLREKADSRGRLMRLTSPVDGTVQQLAVHTQGGVVTEAQPLMVIVPSDNPLEVEAMFENKDIGFVKAGQEAAVKIETFQYTKYGTIDAEVATVSHDAINDEKRGLIYSSRVRMDKTTLMVDGTEVSLSPGMAVTVEVKTGSRRVIEYFLAPLLQHTSESLRER
jgi:hemolysin D